MFRRTFLAVLLATLAFAQPTYFPSAIGDFDGGVGDYYSRASDLTGNADGKTGIVSLWFRKDGGDGDTMYLLRNSSHRFYVSHNTANILSVSGRNSAHTVILKLSASTASLQGSTWHHLLCSWDTSGVNSSKLYLDDVDKTNLTTLTNDTIEYTSAGFSVADIVGGGYSWNGAISEPYFTPNQYLDFSVEANRRKFISADLKPVSLGASGRDPTGTPPLIYLPNGDATKNKGTGGSFTKVGDPTPTQGPNPPEDIWRPGSRATDFDPTPDYLSRGSDLVGNADGKTGIISAWVRVDGGDGDQRMIFQNFAGYAALIKTSGNTIRVLMIAIGPTNLVSMYSLTQATAGSGWHHVLASWDVGNDEKHLYFDGVEDRGSTSIIDGTINYTQTSWWVGARNTPDQFFDGAISELYFAPNQYLDFSVEANRRKFIDANGYPVYLGSDGSLPTGTAPILYLKGAYHNAGTNSGTGGDFVINGTPKYTPGPSTTPWWFDPKPKALSLEGHSGQREVRQ